ncbi:MAG TPA: hypothetical protein VGE69_00975 [Pseudomonadales bacterium]
MKNQDEILRAICLGNDDALGFLLMLGSISQVWDDLIDRDMPVGDIDINQMMLSALIDMQYNPFYQQHQAALLPVMELAIINWQTANHHEIGRNAQMLHVSYVKRSVLTDIMIWVARLVGGRAHALQLAPAIEAAVFLEDANDYEHYRAEVLRTSEGVGQNQQEKN